MGKYFGTDGFRGEAGITLTADHAYKVGRFLGWYYNALRERNGDTDPARIVIGKDTRRSSYMFEYSLVAGLTASGADAYLLHVTTTPSVAYIARVDDFDCGIMISASHNPYYDTQSELYEKTISNMLECKSRGAYLMGLTTYGKYEIEDQVNFTVYVPKVDEHFVGSLAVIPLQLLGYYVSVAKGLDVDKPRNLAKSVTVE